MNFSLVPFPKIKEHLAGGWWGGRWGRCHAGCCSPLTLYFDAVLLILTMFTTVNTRRLNPSHVVLSCSASLCCNCFISSLLSSGDHFRVTIGVNPGDTHRCQLQLFRNRVVEPVVTAALAWQCVDGSDVSREMADDDLMWENSARPGKPPIPSSSFSLSLIWPITRMTNIP